MVAISDVYATREILALYKTKDPEAAVRGSSTAAPKAAEITNIRASAIGQGAVLQRGLTRVNEPPRLVQLRALKVRAEFGTDHAFYIWFAVVSNG